MTKILKVFILTVVGFPFIASAGWNRCLIKRAVNNSNGLNTQTWPIVVDTSEGPVRPIWFTKVVQSADIITNLGNCPIAIVSADESSTFQLSEVKKNESCTYNRMSMKHVESSIPNNPGTDQLQYEEIVCSTPFAKTREEALSR